MALTLRTVKGSPLTATEMDNNLKELQKVFIQATAPVGATAPYIWIQIDGSNLLIWVEDGT